jgi:hypothetical protein
MTGIFENGRGAVRLTVFLMAMSQQMERPMTFQMQDISREVFGKYQYGTMHYGLWYSDEDFVLGGGCGPLKWGAIPAPGPDRRPWRGVLVEMIRRAMGAPRVRR